MQQDPRPTLDYSSPAEEDRREQAAEAERREAIEQYNDSTFGERRPMASAFARRAIVVAIAFVLLVILPRNIARPTVSVMIVALLLWEWKLQG